MIADYEVKKIEQSLTKQWLLEKHYAKRLPTISYAFGLYRNNELEGVLTFGTPASHQLTIGVCGKEYKHYVLELNRLVINSGNERNVASFLIANGLKNIGNKVVVSYADTDWCHIGYVYQATNWIYTGATKERTDMFAGDGKHSRHNKGDKSIRQKRSSKHRYIYFTGDKRFKRKAMIDLKYKIMPYPKGETKKYDCIDIKWNNEGLFSA